MFAYRVGFHGWQLLAQHGCSLKIKATVAWDDEAQLFVGECTDFEPYLGIATEAPTIGQLEEKLSDCCREALVEALPSKTAGWINRIHITLQSLPDGRL